MRCPCGYRGDARRECHCSTPQIERYMAKISGPLVDRIDIHIEVPAVPFQEIADSRAGTSSAQMRDGVQQARAIQEERFKGLACRQNAHMNSRHIRRFCSLEKDGQDLLRHTMNELGLSARGHDKILRVARTIADLEGSKSIGAAHLGEAVNYRMLDRNLWS